MSLELELSDPHWDMYDELKDEHGDDFELHLLRVVESEIHKSYQDLR
jgi:hypothetical protein